jgi:hypothetical protein
MSDMWDAIEAECMSMLSGRNIESATSDGDSGPWLADRVLGILAGWLPEIPVQIHVPGHRPFVEDDGICCGFNVHDGCGEPWPCSTVRAAMLANRPGEAS